MRNIERLYEDELDYIRRLGVEFARDRPKMAARLELDLESGRTTDPHVERLIEAFAFLTARIRLKLEDEFPEITDAFLNVLYPHYLAPLPSMAVVVSVMAVLCDGRPDCRSWSSITPITMRRANRITGIFR